MGSVLQRLVLSSARGRSVRVRAATIRQEGLVITRAQRSAARQVELAADRRPDTPNIMMPAASFQRPVASRLPIAYPWLFARHSNTPFVVHANVQIMIMLSPPREMAPACRHHPVYLQGRYAVPNGPRRHKHNQERCGVEYGLQPQYAGNRGMWPCVEAEWRWDRRPLPDKATISSMEWKAGGGGESVTSQWEGAMPAAREVGNAE